MKSCKTCVYQYRDKCLLTLKAATGPACEDYEEPRPPREKVKEVWGG